MSDHTTPTPRQGVLDISPYIGGEAAGDIRLASNEGALGPCPAAVSAYREMGGRIHRYPDGGSNELRDALGRRWGLDPARVVCGTGSDDLLNLLCRAYAGPGDEVLYSRHGFVWYPICAQAAGATPVTAPETNLKTDVDAILDRVTPRTKVVFVANPNNPTGSFLTTDELERLRAGLPRWVLLVVDMAYAEYVTRNDYPIVTDLVERYDNVVMTRTFSKLFGLAALRLGWAYCPAGVADVLNRVRGPFNVPAAAQAAGVAALSDLEFQTRSREHNEVWREWLAKALSDLGLTVHPSIANFILVSFKNAEEAEATRQHLRSRSILVRQMGSYGLPQCLRISVGLEHEMKAVVEAMRDRPGA